MTRAGCRRARPRLEILRPAAHPSPCPNGGPSAAGPSIYIVPGPPGVRGRGLPGRRLRTEVVTGEPVPPFGRAPGDPHYPGGAPAWTSLPATGAVLASAADAVFNAEDARHRVAHHLSHYGGQPSPAGDFNGDGVEDLLITEHFAYVDGLHHAGEVHLYYGRRGERLDPRRQVPDVVFYGDEAGAKLGLSIGPGGDVNGDGWDDLLMSAGFHSTAGGPAAGRVYVVYGGYLQAFGCTVKVRARDIGGEVPGLVLDGGHDGRRYTGWANDLEAGDVDGDGLSDVLIGAADPYPGARPTFSARAYLVYGSRRLPRRASGYRLGVDRAHDRIRSSVFDAPDGELTRQSLGWGAYVPADVDGDGRDDVVLCAGAAGPTADGECFLFRGRAGGFGDAVVPLSAADTVIAADASAGPPLRFRRLEGARPAGDVNGDGRQDLLMGARRTERLTGDRWRPVGAIAVLLGRPRLPARRHVAA